MASITITGLSEQIARLARIERGDFAQSALDAAALYVKGKVAVYPAAKRLTRKAVYGSSFKTDKQRRGFFAKLRSGEIEVPYRRGVSRGSQSLGRKWTIAARGIFTRVIGNNVSYGPLMQDRDHPQSRYAQAVGWQTIQDVAAREAANAQRLVEAEIAKALKE
jgi:hypothetical protein